MDDEHRQLEDLRYWQHPKNWIAWPFLPVKHVRDHGPGNFPILGMIHADEPLVVYVGGHELGELLQHSVTETQERAFPGAVTFQLETQLYAPGDGPALLAELKKRASSVSFYATTELLFADWEVD